MAAQGSRKGCETPTSGGAGPAAAARDQQRRRRTGSGGAGPAAAARDRQGRRGTDQRRGEGCGGSAARIQLAAARGGTRRPTSGDQPAAAAADLVAGGPAELRGGGSGERGATHGGCTAQRCGGAAGLRRCGGSPEKWVWRE
ncbi:hypothetical protein Syun_013589 [Stephania yunnanensis]|uniref:Uncharacterized protein n=1 Tax=Stephania yunnanensis TaxID=152371 RepID=A0AAP0P8T9_9MAGN